MAIDLNKVLKAKQQIEDRNKKPDFGPRAQFWRPTKAKSRIRIMPDWTKEGEFAGQFWREVVQHWIPNPDNGGKPVPTMCEEKTPYMSGEKCDVCAYVDELRANKTSVEAQELAKNLRGKTAYLLTIIDLDDPTYTAADVAEAMAARPEHTPDFAVGEAKFQVYAAPQTVFNTVCSIINNSGVDITSITEGYDLTLEKSGSGITTKYNVSPFLKPTVCKYVNDTSSLPALDKVGQTMDKEKVRNMLPAGPAPVAALPATTTKVSTARSPKAFDVALGSGGDDDDLDKLSSSLREALIGS